MSTPSIVRPEHGSKLSESFRLLGIEFAPLHIPFERRLQTLAVFIWMSLFLFMGLGSAILLIYLLYTDYKWLTFVYLAWVVFDWDRPENGGRNFNFVRRWRLWKYFANYFPITIVKTSDLDPDRSYLFGSHPHGLLCAGAFCTFATDAMDFSRIFPGFQSRLLTIRSLFWFPGLRELFLSTGSCAATKQGMENLLKIPKGQVSVLVVGGAPEAANSDKDCLKLVLNRRKGFVKLALRFGVDLVPTFSFGEYVIYDQVANPVGSRLRRFQNWFESVAGFTPILFFGRGMFQYNYGFVPYRKPITIVVGKPIRVEKVDNPTSEQIVSLHSKYVESIVELYNEYNPKYGDDKLKLIIE